MSTTTVLIIDDNDVDRFILKRHLMGTGLDIATEECDNGQNAIDQLTEALKAGNDLPKVIFLDINMPIMNGFEFLAAFTDLLDTHGQTACPVMMYSHSLDPSDQERAAKFAFVDYREKSVFNSELLATLLPSKL